MYVLPKFDIDRPHLRETEVTVVPSPKMCVAENVLNLPARAAAPREKYITVWISADLRTIT